MSDWTSGSLPAILPPDVVSGLRAVLKAVRAAMDAAQVRDAFFSLNVSAVVPPLPPLPSLEGISLDASVHMLVVPVVAADVVNPAAVIDSLTLAAQLGLDPDLVTNTLSAVATRPEDGVKRLADTVTRSLSDAGDPARPLYGEHDAVTCIAMVAAADDPADLCAAAAAIEFAANPAHSLVGALAPPPRDLRMVPGSSGLVQLTGAPPAPSMLSNLSPARTALFLAEDAACLRGRRAEDFLASAPTIGTFKTQLGRLKCAIYSGTIPAFAREAWQYAAVATEYTSGRQSCWSGLSDWTRLPAGRVASAPSSFPDWVMLPNPLALRPDLTQLGKWAGNLSGKAKVGDVLNRAREKSKAANDRAEAALQLLAASGGGVYATSFSGSGGTSFLLRELTRRLTAADGPGASPKRYATGVFVVLAAAGIANVPGSFSATATAGLSDPLLSPATAPPVPSFDDSFRPVTPASAPPSSGSSTLATPDVPSAPGLTSSMPLGHDLTPVPSADDRNPTALVTGKEPVKC